MPLGIDPEETHWIWLRRDEAKPEETRPAFQCRYLTVGKVRKARAAVDAAAKAEEDEKAIAILMEVLGGAIVGWRNLPGAYSADALLDVLTPLEMFELTGRLVSGSFASELEKKRSASPSGSDTATTAPPAGGPAAA